MSHARIEEVSDSDPSEGDISDVESEEFDEREILKARPSQAAKSITNPSAIPSTTNSPAPNFTGGAPGGTQFHDAGDDSKYKDFQCIYPVYFDKNRSRKEGRRVGVELAVENPLASEIANACGRLRLESLFEPAKTHPKDWANPGRVKIKLKGGRNSSIKNSMFSHFYLCNALLIINRTSPLYPSIRTSTEKPYNSSTSNDSPRTRRATSRPKERIPKASYPERMEDGYGVTLLQSWIDRRRG